MTTSMPVSAQGETISLGSWKEKGPLEVWLLDGAGAGEPKMLRRQPSSHLGIEGPEGRRRFRGGLIFTSWAGAVRVVNRLPLEEYITGVVAAEMPLSYPLEALKAQAIASRTYALYEMLWQKDHGGPRPFSQTASFQAYRGVEPGAEKAVRAVLETAGEVLIFRGALFRSYFHSTCGGSTLSAASVFGDAAIAPLGGTKCDACAPSPLARWQECRPEREIESALAGWARDRGIELGPIDEITVAEARDERVTYLRVRAAAGSFEIRADRFRALLAAARGASLPSSTFQVRLDSGGFCFEGQGFGHRVGLCQVGAGRLGEAGTCRQILAKYYPLSEIEPLPGSQS
jgi:stage II sporulation protein D